MFMELRKITENEYNTVANEIKEEYITNQENKNNNDYEHHNFVNFTNYDSNYYGIIVDEKVTGLIRLQNFRRNLSIDLYVLPKYRHQGIGFAVSNILIDTLGKIYPDKEYFHCNVDAHNTKSLNLVKKLGWQVDYDLMNLFNDEGAEDLIIFTVKNPYYNLNLNEQRGHNR